MKAIVTVKIEVEKIHSSKELGDCPIRPNTFCTDSEGKHHSVVIEGSDFQEIQETAEILYEHITRIEII